MKMRWSFLARVFPLLVFFSLLLLLLAGKSNLPPEMVYRYFELSPAKADGIMAAVAESRGAGGWLKSLHLPKPPGPIDRPDLSIVDTGTAMTFAQVGDGVISSTQFFQTTLILINQTNNQSSGTIEFYDNDGNPLAVKIDGVTGSSFPFTLNTRQTKRFKTSGESNPVKVGWAQVHSDQPIGGTATFGIRNKAGKVFTDVGVAESPVGKEFMLFADTKGQSRTAMALANPSGDAVLVDVELYDTAGVLKSTKSATLPPWGHIALFLDELFKGVSGIQEFEGSAVISSDSDFCGLTLRSTGDQLSSMPMIQVPPDGVAWTKVAFAHVGDGTSGGISINTTVILMNNLGVPATGAIQFYRSTGEEMTVKIGNKQASLFEFSLPPNAVGRFVTSGTGELKTGFAVVSMDQPIGGTALFSLYNGAGVLDTEVGVGAVPLQKTFSIVADSLDVYNTGLALAYPLPQEFGSENSVNLTLFDSNGYWKASKSVPLKNFQHEAKFITQLFPDVAGINEFDGRIDVSANQFVAFLSLRQAGTKMTSMPYFQKRYGFAPTSTVQFAQDLASPVSPSMSWRLVQNSSDFALEAVSLSVPSLGFNPAGIEVGDRVGYGTFISDEQSRTYELVMRQTGSVVFDLIAFSSEGMEVIGEGVIGGKASKDLKVDLNFFDKLPFTYVGSQLETEFWLTPGIVTVPSSGVTIPVTTEFESVSSDPYRENRLRRRTVQQLVFKPPSNSLANLLKVSPVFLKPGDTAKLEGTNFGATPTALFDFRMFDETTYQYTNHTVPVIPSADSNAWTATVPTLFSSVPSRGYPELTGIRVDNGSGAGNTFLSRFSFAPSFRFYTVSTKGGANTNYSFTLDQAPGQLAMVWFQVGVFGVQVDFASLKAGDLIGVGKYEDDDYQLKVNTVAANEVVVDVIEEGQSEAFGKLTLQRFPDALPTEHLPSLGMIFETLEPPLYPHILSDTLRLEWEFTGLPIRLPAAGKGVQVSANVLSAPNSIHSTGLQVDFGTYFITTAE